jgi:hypothetical protein
MSRVDFFYEAVLPDFPRNAPFQDTLIEAPDQKSLDKGLKVWFILVQLNQLKEEK